MKSVNAIEKTWSIFKRTALRLTSALLFTFMMCSYAYAQNNSPTKETKSSLLNQVYFKVVVSEISLVQHFDQLDAAFNANKIEVYRKDLDQHYLLLICSKGCVIEDIKKTLSIFTIGIITYQESYTNEKPDFFQ
jgi:hypothetical protein